ncbi:endoglucanase [Eubacterium ruminantium]|nr:endoglucanase [Eubacterium ruminantium]
MSEENNKKEKDEIVAASGNNEKKGMSKGVFIIIAVLALLVIGLVAFIIGDKTKKKSDKNDNNTTVSSEKTTENKADNKTEEKTEEKTEKKTEEKTEKTTSEDNKKDDKKNPLFDTKSDIYLVVDDKNGWAGTDGFTRQYGIDIFNNSGDSLKDWRIELSGFKGNVKLGDNWCGNYKLADGKLTITSLDYNNEIASGATTNIGFMIIFESEDNGKTAPDIRLFAGNEEIKGDKSEDSKSEDKSEAKTEEKTEDKKDDKTEKTEDKSDDKKDEKKDDKSEVKTEFEKHGKLSVSGVDIVDKDGKKYQLHGVSTHGIAWFPDYVNKDAFKTLRDDWGVNLIRLAMYTDEGMGYCTDGNKDEIRALVEKGVDAATELGMYVIIDWHILHDLTPLTYKDEAVSFFTEMSKKYADHDNVIYEICNEPNGGTSWSDVKSYAEEVIPVIRKNAPDSIIIVGTPNWSQDVDKAAADPLSFDNVMYAVHFYAATHKDDIRNKAIEARKSGAPVFISEFSICDASGNGGIDYDSAEEWMKYLDENDMSYAIWSLCNKDETAALIAPSCNKKSGWSEDELSETGKWYKKHLGK